MELLPLSRRRALRLGAAIILAGAAAVLPATALQAEAPHPPLPAAIQAALENLSELGFADVVRVYQEFEPAIEIEPTSAVEYGGLTEGWATTPRITASIRLRADIVANPPLLNAILAHELLHVWQFAYAPDLYADCVAREVAAYTLEARVLRAWCTANPSAQHELIPYYLHLMSVVEQRDYAALEAYSATASCGGRLMRGPERADV